MKTPIILSQNIGEQISMPTEEPPQSNLSVIQEIEDHFNQTKYGYTRFLISALEKEQFIDIIENLYIDSFSEVSAKRLIDYIYPASVGISDNFLIFKFKKQPGNVQNDPFWGYVANLNKQLTVEREKAARNEDAFLPTAGVFAEAIMGRSNASEFINPRRFWNWQDSPIPHLAPQIAPIQAGNHVVTDQGSILNPNVPASNLNIINPPQYALPTSLNAALQAVQNGNMFRDMSKSGELVNILGKLADLANNTAQISGNLTGQAADNALKGAIELGNQVAGMMNNASNILDRDSNTAPSPKTPTEKGAALNNLDDIKKNSNPDGSISPIDQAAANAMGTPISNGEGQSEDEAAEESDDNDEDYTDIQYNDLPTPVDENFSIGSVSDFLFNEGVDFVADDPDELLASGESESYLFFSYKFFDSGGINYYTPSFNSDHLMENPQFFNETVEEKTQIYIHHTASNSSAANVVANWNDNQLGYSTPFVIGGKPNDEYPEIKDGEIYQTFNPDNWSYHLKISLSSNIAELSDKFPNISIPSSWNDFYKKTIGIEICNWSWLNDDFTTYTGIEIKQEDIIEYPNEFRGYKYYHRYSDNQLKSLKLLLIYICNKYNIPKYNRVEGVFELIKEPVEGEKGIFTHASVRYDKPDCHPQPELIKVLEEIAMIGLFEDALEKLRKNLIDTFKNITPVGFDLEKNIDMLINKLLVQMHLKKHITEESVLDNEILAYYEAIGINPKYSNTLLVFAKKLYGYMVAFNYEHVFRGVIWGANIA